MQMDTISQLCINFVHFMQTELKRSICTHCCNNVQHWKCLHIGAENTLFSWMISF